MDFYMIATKEEKDGTFTVYPDWVVHETKDLLVNQGSFQAVWVEETGLWSTNEYDVAIMVDKALEQRAQEVAAKSGHVVNVKSMRAFSSKSWNGYKRHIRDLPENRHDLNATLVFANSEVKKEDYATHRLPYALEPGSIDAWDEIVGTLYSPEERAKIEWAIGAVVSGDSVKIQKFLVFYGKPGSGKSTILDVILNMFHGYTTIFNAKELTSSSNQFATAPFALNPLVAIQHDGDLSRIEDNTILNMITAHEDIIINQKFAKPYEIKSKALLFLASNDPVKIKNAKAGIIRRLIDIVPSGNLIDVSRYHDLVGKIQFEFGAIAHYCLQTYLSMGAEYYIDYTPVRMQYQTDVFYNFVESCHDIFKAENGVTLKQAWVLYKEYCEEAGVPHKLPQHRFRAELENYFEHFHERIQLDGVQYHSYFEGYKDIMKPTPVLLVEPYSIELFDYDPIINTSVFNEMYPDQPAQYTRPGGSPAKAWENVTTTLKDMDPTELHYVKIPEQHIVIDFDLTDEDGKKDRDRNLEEASKWPATYAELSRSGSGVHLHYIYVGDVSALANVYDVGIEVKTLLGNESLRRKLTKCNALEVSTISSGLPRKEKRSVLDDRSIQSEKGLRELIERNLRKEIHPGTKPSVDFIHKILEDAFEAGLSYDVRDMRSKILAFAAKSSNQASLAIKTVQTMKFVGKENMPPPENMNDAPIVFYDVEVFPNLFIVCWKTAGENQEVVRMINPRPHDVEPLLSQKLVGFNNRRYDNHILYARYLGHSLEELHRLSQKLINNNQNAYFGEAYNLSYTDIYDFSSKKQGLKRFMIDLGITHMEIDLPWDQPVPEEMWDKVADYCANDVIGTEAVFNDRKQDFVARQILADLSGLTVNHTTQQHTAKIIFGGDKRPQDKFVYTQLDVLFEGYHFDGKESTYRGEVVGEGGYVYAEPGIYDNVALLDVASMHPTSIEELNLFGPYTKTFSELKKARMAIKHRDYDVVRQPDFLGGRLAKFLENAEAHPENAEALAYALKIVINIVYGLTSARFDSPFRDPRNKDNIVAKRGALFMIELKHAVQEKGFTVAHIKTDSIKIPHATPEIIDFVTSFGRHYGYDFEQEATYDKFCLVNDAVYIAKVADSWYAVGKQFQHPYVFKTLFSKEPVEFEDLCETRTVNQGAIYLDTSGSGVLEGMVHVGRVGSFVPVRYGGGDLWRVKDGKKYAVTGTKGYKWITRETATNRNVMDELIVDMEYFDKLEKDARAAIEQFGSYLDFVM
jgi:hypothetical protein